MQSDEYEKALDLAKDNYLNRPSNPINANNYFAWLIRRPRTPETRDELERIVERLAIDQSERATEMTDSMRARIVAYYDDDEARSMELIEAAICMHADIDYPVLTKADLAVHFENKEKLREAVLALERVTSQNAQSYRTFIKFRAISLAMEGHVEQARRLVRKELSGLIPSALQRLNGRIEHAVKNGSS